MPLRFDVFKQLSARSDRVKSVDLHPQEPWLLAALYSGNCFVWNTQTAKLVKTFEVTDQPVRAAKFCVRKQWVICGSDDNMITVYSYDTMEKVKAFEAHADYIRAIAVHPVQPFVITSSDDLFIKLWDWEKNWQNTQIFEGHSHYVMYLTINPKDTNTFASASLDRTIKVWGFNSPTPHFTLEGHEKGVNVVEYMHGGDRPYLISGSDDATAKVWDYQNKSCVQTLEGHTDNVTAVAFHPELPLIVTGSEDNSIRLWNSNTYRLEKSLNHGMERCWTIAAQKGSNGVAIGYDEGAVMIKIGRDDPAVSMDSSGKVIWAKHNEVQQVNVRTASDAVDGEALGVSVKDLGQCDIFPQSLQHNSNGRFVTVCGDGEYIIYTALAWRNKGFGSGLDFVWRSEGTGDYAVRESTQRVKIFNNFKEGEVMRPNFSAEKIFGGHLLGVMGRGLVVFYDWKTLNIVRSLDVPAVTDVLWSDNGEMCAICTEASIFLLRYKKDPVQQFFATGGVPEPDVGIEDAFDVLHEVADRVKTGRWVGDCFVYTSHANRLCYAVGGETVTLAHPDVPLYLLGYLPQTNRLYCIDRDLKVLSYTIDLNVINFQTAVLRGDVEMALATYLPKIPDNERGRVAQFLDSQGLKEEALSVAIDPEHRFDLAIQLSRLDTAVELAESHPEQLEGRWKQLGDFALSSGNFSLAERCLSRAGDTSGLLLLHTSTANAEGLRELGKLAASQGRQNISFITSLLTGDVPGCVDTLCESGRVPEASLFARSYSPSVTSDMVKLWKDSIVGEGKGKGSAHMARVRTAESLADPAEYPHLFPGFERALGAEKQFFGQDGGQRPLHPSHTYSQHVNDLDRDLVEEAGSGSAVLEASNNASPPLQRSPSPEPLPGPPVSLVNSSAADTGVLVDEGQTDDLLGSPAPSAQPTEDILGGQTDDLLGSPAPSAQPTEDILGGDVGVGAADLLGGGADPFGGPDAEPHSLVNSAAADSSFAGPDAGGDLIGGADLADDFAGFDDPPASGGSDLLGDFDDTF